MHKIKHLSDKRIKPDLLNNFLNFINDELEIDTPYSVYFIKDKINAAEALGKTAMYNPATKSVYIYVTNRHPKDILRSIAHELVHHKQHCDGELENMSLEDAEIDANAGGYLLRQFEDQLKGNKLQEATKKCPAGFTLRALGKVGDTSSEFCLPTELSWQDNLDKWSIDDILAARTALWEDDFSDAKNRKKQYKIDNPNPVKKQFSSAADRMSSTDVKSAIRKVGSGSAKPAILRLITDPLLIYKTINMFSSLRTAPRPPEDYIKKFGDNVNKAFMVAKEPKSGDKDYQKKMKLYKEYEKIMKVHSAYKEYFMKDYFPGKKKVNEQEDIVKLVTDNPLLKGVSAASEPTKEADRGAFASYTPEQLKAAQAVYRASGIGGGILLDPKTRKKVGVEEPKTKSFKLTRKKSKKEFDDELKRRQTPAGGAIQIPAATKSVDLPPELIKKFSDYYSKSPKQDAKSLDTKAREIYSVSPFTYKSDIANKEEQEERDQVLNLIMLASLVPLPYVAVLDGFLALYHVTKYLEKGRNFTDLPGDIVDDTDLQMALLQTFVTAVGTKGIFDARAVASGSELFGTKAKLDTLIDKIKKGVMEKDAINNFVTTANRLLNGLSKFGKRVKIGSAEAIKTKGGFSDVINKRVIDPALDALKKLDNISGVTKGAGEVAREIDAVARRNLMFRMQDIATELYPLFVGRSTDLARSALKGIDVGSILKATKNSRLGKEFRELLKTNLSNVKRTLNQLAESGDDFIVYLKEQNPGLHDKIFTELGRVTGADGGFRVAFKANKASVDDILEAFIIYMKRAAETNPRLSKRLQARIFSSLTDGKNAAKLGMESLTDLLIEPIAAGSKIGAKKAEKINKLLKELLEGEKVLPNGSTVQLSQDMIASTVKEILELKLFLRNGKLSNSGIARIAKKTNEKIKNIVSGDGTLSMAEGPIQKAFIEVQDRIIKLFLSSALRKFGALKGVEGAGLGRQISKLTDRVLSPDAFYMTGAGNRTWTRYVTGNRFLKSWAKQKSGIIKVLEWALTAVIFKSLLPIIFYTKIYGPNCKISFQQYLRFFNNSTFANIGSFTSSTKYDVSTARRELNAELDKFFDTSEPKVSIQKIFGLSGCKHVRDLVQTGELTDKELSQKLEKMKNKIKRGALKAEQQTKIAAKKVKEEYEKAVKSQLGADYEERIESIKNKIKNGKQLTDEDRKYIEKVKKLQGEQFKKLSKTFDESNRDI
jgi:hypothetical protein